MKLIANRPGEARVLGMPIWLSLAYALLAALVSFASWSVAASR